MILLLLLQVLIETSKPALPPCGPGAAAFCSPADAQAPTVTLIASTGGVLPDSVNITGAYYTFHFATSNDGTFGNVVKAALFIDGAEAGSITGQPLTRTLQIRWQPRTIERGRPYKAFVRVWDADGRMAESKTVTVTRQ